jgi:hypothetical protein
MEDVSFSAVAFYFVFAGAGQAFSLDALWGTQVWGRLPAGSLLPELALAVAFGNIFLSAGVTKLPSRMWRRGLGTYYFYLMPNFRRMDTSFLTRNLPLMKAMNYTALAMEFLLLPALLINAVPFGLLFWCLALGFALQLSTVFLLTWIGESLIVGLLPILWLILYTGTGGMAGLLVRELGALREWPGMAIAVVLLASLFAGLWIAIVAESRWLPGWKLLRAFDRAMRYVVRHTWGLIPCEVFTEVHMEGPVVYRVFAETPESDREVYRLFSEKAQPGKDRSWKPAFFEVTSYKVAETCMELDLWNEVRTMDRERFILEMSEYILRRYRKAVGEAQSLRYEVRQIVAPPEFCGADAEGYYTDWREAFRVPVDGGRALRIVPLRQGILPYPTGRRLKVNTFHFNPDNVEDDLEGVA